MRQQLTWRMGKHERTAGVLGSRRLSASESMRAASLSRFRARGDAYAGTLSEAGEPAYGHLPEQVRQTSLPFPSPGSGACFVTVGVSIGLSVSVLPGAAVRKVL